MIRTRKCSVTSEMKVIKPILGDQESPLNKKSKKKNSKLRPCYSAPYGNEEE